MSPLLLVLILFSDPSGEKSAGVIGEELTRVGGKQVQVQVGPDAVKALEGMGLKAHDLVVSPDLANHLTAEKKQVVIIRVDRRSVAGDEILESKVWAGGRSDSHIAIAGNGGDPLAGAISGIFQIIGPRLPTQPDIAPTTADAELATLAEGKQWKALVDRLSKIEQPDPRQCYYLILGQANIGNTESARETYGLMKKLYAGHFLTRAAEVLVPAGARRVEQTPAQKPATNTEPDDGSNTLRDKPAESDDGSNVLR